MDMVFTTLNRAVTMQDASHLGIARAMGAPPSTVRDILLRWEPVVGELRQHKKDLLLGTWQWLYLDTLDDLVNRRESGTLTPRDRQTLTWTMGVATDKVQVLAGLPTAIVAGMHEVRMTLPEVASRLATLASRVITDGKVIESKRLAGDDTALPMPKHAGGGLDATVAGGLGTRPGDVGASTVPSLPQFSTKGPSVSPRKRSSSPKKAPKA
jgi:hypothetical protein